MTERQYLEGFERWARNATVRIEIAKDQGVPLTLVQVAREMKRAAERAAQREEDDNLLYDEVWCVFDTDDHPHLNDAVQMARDNGVELAVSNPCFELWLLLHLRESPGPQHRQALQRMIRAFLPNYGKHIDFSACKGSAPSGHGREHIFHESA